MDNTESSGENEQPKAEHVVTPIQTPPPECVNPKDIRLFREPAWKLRLTIQGDRSYLMVRVVRAAPLSQPSRYICFLDEKNEVIWTVEDPSVLDAESRRILKEELNQRYLTTVIQAIDSLKNEFGVSYWDVQTNRGNREFVVRNVSESAQWIAERRLLLIDVDGNRFEIPDLDALDKRSLSLIEMLI